MSRFLDQLRDRVLFFDGGMGTQVQARELTAENGHVESPEYEKERRAWPTASLREVEDDPDREA